MNYLEIFVKVTSALVVILFFTRLAGNFMRLISQPRVVGEMIAGVLLGPTLLGYLFPGISETIFNKEVMPFLFIICNIGLSFYMFLVGTEINMNLFDRKTMKLASSLSFAAILVPFICGFFIAWFYGELINTRGINFFSFGVFLGTALSITAFPMLARILQEKGIIGTHIGVISMISASIQDVISWILLGFVTALAGGKSLNSLYTMVAGAVFLVAFLFLIVKPLISNRIRKNTKNDFDENLFAFVVFLLIICAIITDHIGLYSVFGGFVLGLAIPREGSFIKDITIRIKDLVVILFLPVFFAFSGLNTDMNKIANSNLFIPTLFILAFSFLSKYVPIYSVMRFFNHSNKDSLSIAALMNSRGLMELIIANIGLFYGLIDLTLYSVLVLIAITTTLSAMPCYEFFQKRIKN